MDRMEENVLQDTSSEAIQRLDGRADPRMIEEDNVCVVRLAVPLAEAFPIVIPRGRMEYLITCS